MRTTDRARLLVAFAAILVVTGCGGPATSGVSSSPVGAVAASAAAQPVSPAVSTSRPACPVTADQPVGTIVTFAGTGDAGFSGDGGPATAAQIDDPQDVVVDGAGNVFFGEGSHRVRRVDPDGIVTTVAGTGEPGSSGDGGRAVDAKLNRPSGLAMGLDGAMFVADFDEYRIRRIDSAGIITTVVGTGVLGTDGDGGPALEATIQALHIAIGSDGTMYFDDLLRYRSVAPDGSINAFAGTGRVGFSGDGGLATAAAFGEVQGVAIDLGGNVYLADLGNLRIRRVAPDGMVSTVAGSGSSGYDGDGGPARAAAMKLPIDLATAPDGTLFISDYFGRAVRRVAPDGTISTVAGGRSSASVGDCGPAVEASLAGPTGLAVRDGMLYIVDRDGDRIRRVALGE